MYRIGLFMNETKFASVIRAILHGQIRDRALNSGVKSCVIDLNTPKVSVVEGQEHWVPWSLRDNTKLLPGRGNGESQ